MPTVTDSAPTVIYFFSKQGKGRCEGNACR
jgi:hypothetical protein